MILFAVLMLTLLFLACWLLWWVCGVIGDTIVKEPHFEYIRYTDKMRRNDDMMYDRQKMYEASCAKEKE